jgi:restriction endonuclease S subunit
VSGWPKYTLGDLTSSTRPICYGVLKPGPNVDDGVPLVKIVDMQDRSVKMELLHRISADLDEEFSRSRLRGGEVLLSIQGTIGRVAIVPDALAGANISRTVALIEPDDRVLAGYLAYQLELLADKEAFAVGGSTRNSLNIGDLRRVEIAVPPLEEQQRIVAKLDEVDRQVGAARAVHRSELHHLEGLESFSLMDLVRIEGWPDTNFAPIAELAQFRRGLTYAKSDEVGTSSKIVLRANNIDASTGQIVLAELRYLRNEFEIPADKMLVPGSVLLCMSSGSKSHLGKSAFVEDPLGMAFGGFMGLLVPRAGVSGRYLHLATQSREFKSHVQQLADGANINNLKFADIAPFGIPVPPKHVQESIVQRMDARRAIFGALRTNAKQRDLLLQAFQTVMYDITLRGAA